jgi:hypothetical protein
MPMVMKMTKVEYVTTVARLVLIVEIVIGIPKNTAD